MPACREKGFQKYNTDMNNSDIATIFDHIADLLEIKGEIIYKTLAYRRAAESIRMHSTEVAGLTQKELKEIPGIGQAIAEKIEELNSTGKLDFLQKLESEVPPSLIDLLRVPDLGPKKAALFWKQAGITNLEQLEKAARTNKLSGLPGMGEKSQAHILAGIERLKQEKKRLSINKALAIAEKWLEKTRTIPGLRQLEAAGSLRRWKPTIGDLDFVGAAEEPAKVMQAFLALDGIREVLSQGEHKTSVVTEDGLNLQLWLQPPERFGSLLQFVTGSKEHNVRLREYALKQELSLSERGFVDQNLKETLCPTEKDVYQKLGLAYIPPEMREDRGEILLVAEKRMPDLVCLEDIRADLHIHSDWTDSRATIEEMVQAAILRGLKVLAITDHSHATTGVSGLDEKRWREQADAIKQVREKFGNSITILHGLETEILEDGSLDTRDEVLAEMDIVLASMHEDHGQPREVITPRMVKAMRNPQVDILAHPAGRELPRTNGADLNWEQIYNAAKENQVALEIDSNPVHFDMDEVQTRRAAEKGVLISIDTDSHATHKLDHMKYGVAIARRAWVNKASILNTWPTEKLIDWLKNRR
jgi:DNA polymerase (family X)